MNDIYNVKLNSFYQLVEQLYQFAGVKNTNHWHSKKMYGNIKLTYLACKMQQLQASYRRFIEIIEQDGTQHMLCLKCIPHFTTIQKFVKRTPKHLFEQMVRACRKLLKLKNVVGAIDGTGVSNTNPSHHYLKRCKEQNNEISVKNYTKTIFLADINNNIILDVRTTSKHEHETTAFKPMVKRLQKCLKTVLADKGYDSMSNRKICWNNGIDVHIPFRKWSESRHQEFGTPSKRKMAEKKFDKTVYNQRALIESVNSAFKQTLGGFVRARSASQQQKSVVLKTITYNIEHIQRKIRIMLFLEFQ